MSNPDGGTRLYLLFDKAKEVPLTPIINALQKLPMLPSLINWQGESVLH
jgi:hypothetical protein